MKILLTLFKNFLKDEDGLGTVEIVILIAVLVLVALLFKTAIVNFVKSLLGKVFDTGKIESELGTGSGSK